MSLLKFSLIAFFAYIFSTFFAVGQTTPIRSVSGRLTDRSQQPLAYVSIGIINTPVGTVADEKGAFTLYLNDKVNPQDSVRFSILGYRSISLTVADLYQRLTLNQPLIMDEQAQLLNEVRISSRDTKVKTIGSEKVETSKHTNFAISQKPRQNLGAEIGRVFNTPKGACRLEKYRFYIMSNFESVTFRVNVYDAGDLRPLIDQNIYVPVTGKGKKWVEVDLTPYNIVAQENVIVAIQWIDNSEKGTFLGIPIQIPAFATHYYKYGSQDKWKKFTGMTTAMNLTVTCSKLADLKEDDQTAQK